MSDNNQQAQQQEIVQELVFLGTLEGHTNWVTSIVAGHSQKENEDSTVLVSGSRDKSLIIWKLFEEQSQEGEYGVAHKQLFGHNHFVSDLALSSENSFVLSSSWDKTLRLWDIREGKTVKQFIGHTKEVFSVGFSPDNRQIISAGADKTIKLWNTLAQKKFESENLNHTDWVSQIRYAPLIANPQKQNQQQPYFATVGWDGRLKIWNPSVTVKYSFKVSDTNLNCLSISPNGKYIATGGKDKKLQIWDINDLNQPSRTFDAGSTINCLAFNPKLQWIVAGTENSVKIWNLMSSEDKPLITVQGDSEKKADNKSKSKLPQCTSLTWNSIGMKLFAGFSDGIIRAWKVEQKDKQ